MIIQGSVNSLPPYRIMPVYLTEKHHKKILKIITDFFDYTKNPSNFANGYNQKKYLLGA